MNLDPIYPIGDKEDYVDFIFCGMEDCQKDIAFNTWLRDRWKENAEIVWKANELIKEAVCHLKWLKDLARKAMQ